MTIKSLLLVPLLASGSAFAHGFYFEGNNESNTAVFAEAVEKLDVLQEDETGAIQCRLLQLGVYGCNVLQKHGRPLAAISEYSLGDYMDLEAGDSDSNAAAVFAVLEQKVASGDALTERKEFSAGRVQISRNDGRTKLRCLQDTTAGEAETECRIDTVKN